MPTETKLGLTTIFWGAAGLLSGDLASAIVESLSRKGKRDIGTVEDSKGFTAADVIMDDGSDYEVKLPYDSAITYPDIGDTVLVKTARDSTGKYCYVVDDGDEAQRKKEAMVTLTLRYRVGIDLTP